MTVNVPDRRGRQGSSPLEGEHIRRLSRWQLQDRWEEIGDLYAETSGGDPRLCDRDRALFLRRLALDVPRPGFALLVAERSVLRGPGGVEETPRAAATWARAGKAEETWPREGRAEEAWARVARAEEGSSRAARDEAARTRGMGGARGEAARASESRPSENGTLVSRGPESRGPESRVLESRARDITGRGTEAVELTGCAYGFPLRADGPPWQGLDGYLPRELLPLAASGRLFAISGLLVHSWVRNENQGRDWNLARRLQRRLLADHTTGLADHPAVLGVTLVDRGDTATLGALRSWGWRSVTAAPRDTPPTARCRALVVGP
ncbi:MULTISPECIES: hypothetical protein [Streptomyces]|uniref:Uncharacterized protein n=2 Tax=Streptomyces TaxID=1883 RepID=A0ABV9IY73_9ACTN